MGAVKAGAASAQPPAPGPPASAQGIREKIRTKGKKMVWNAVERVRDSSVAVTRVLRAQADPVEWSINKQMTGHTDGIWDIAVCRWENKEAFCHETMLASASADRTGRIWAVESGREVATLVGHKGSVNSICFHPYEALVCTASGDKSCNVWRLPPLAGQENELCDRDLDLPAPSSSVRSSRCRCLRPVLGTIVF
jgi:WD40 repeat protein